MAEYVETERDRWAEVEARSCDKTAEAFEASGRQWMEKHLHPETAKMVLVCAIKAEAWRDLADRLRRPAMIGREIMADRERL